MKKLISLFFLIISSWTYGQVWSEDFEAEGDAATTGTGNPSGVWTTTCVGCAANVFETNVLGGTYFQVGRLGGGTNAEGVWTSPVISISGFTNIKIYLETSALLTEAGDYLRVYYILDGIGGEILFHTTTNGSVTSTGISPALNGTQIQIVVRAFTDAGFDFFTFDNISVTNTLFSRATAVWGTSGTWSAVAIGGVDCTCTPTQFTDVVVGGTHTVTIGAAATAASLLVNGTADAGGAGTLTYSGNFALDIDGAGALTVNNGGQITSGGNLSAALTFTDNQSHTITNNGTISIGDLTVTNSSLFTPTVITLGGSSAFAITDALSLSESSAQSVTLTNGVTMTIGGTSTVNNTSTFTNNSTVTMSSTAAAVLNGSGTWTQGANSTLNYAGSTLTITTFNALNTGNTVDYNSGIAQNIATTTYCNLTLSNSGAKSAVGSFALRGNWVRSGTATFTPGANTVTFSALVGTAAQSILAVGGETFSSLTINSAFATSPQITLNNTVTVTSVLTMTAGNINLNGNSCTISSTATGALVHGLTSANGWMYGGSFIRNRPASTVIAVGIARTLFPLGGSGDWRPFFVGQTSNANTVGTMTVSHTDATTTSTVSIADTGPIATIVRRHDSFWTLSTSGISAGATFTLRVGGTTFGTIEAGAPGLADLRMSTSAGVVNTHGAATGGPDYRVNRTAVTFANLANNFHVASTDAVNSPLPIELVSFKGEVVEDKIQLTWKTESELNNDFFTVERTVTGEVFSSIGQVNGRGTTSQDYTYSLIDPNPFYGTSYYRLKQTDFDGTFTYSNIISVTYEGSQFPFINVYPNPSKGGQVTIEIKGLKNVETMPVVIYDLLGKELMKITMEVDENSGTASKSLSFERELPKGMYLIMAGPSRLLVKRFVVAEK